MKKLVNFVLSTSLATAASIGVAQAQDINPWQQCGLGAMVFPDNGTAAAISNIVWDLGTTAVSSAASSPDQCEGAGVQVAAFVQLSYDHLSVETAVGEGEFLQTLVTGMNCDPNIQADLVSDLRDDFAAQLQEASYATKGYNDKAEAYYLGLRGVVETGYADACENF